MRPNLFLYFTVSLSGLLIPALGVAQTAVQPPAGSSRDNNAAAQAAPLPSARLPPDLDRVLRDYERAWQAGDAAALAALFAEDGFVLQGGRPPVRGRAAIQAAYAGQGSAPLKLRALAYATGDNVGYIIGAYHYDAAAGGDQGKFTLTLRREGSSGRWLIFSDMDNPSQPPPRRPGTPAGGSVQPPTPSATTAPPASR